MFKKGSTLFVILMLSAVCMFNSNELTVTNTSAITSYTDLYEGNAVLYKFNEVWQEEDTYMEWFEDPSTGYAPLRQTIEMYQEREGIESYLVQGNYGNELEANTTTSLFDKKINDTFYEEHYDYDTDSWYEVHRDDFIGPNYNFSWAEENYYYDVNGSLLNLDIHNMFEDATYVDSSTETLFINGFSDNYTVDYYSASEEYYSSWVGTFYGIDVYYDFHEIFTYDYMIDTDTGFLLGSKREHIISEYGYGYNYSNELNMMVEMEHNWTSNEFRQWEISMTTVQYNPVSDADIPQIKNYYYGSDFTINNGDTDVLVEFEMDDYSSSIDVAFYIDGHLWEYFYNQSNGLMSVQIPVENFDYNGPYNHYNLEVVLYDNATYAYNSTWSYMICDYRTVSTPYPSYLNGSTYYEVDVWQSYYPTFDVVSATNWTLDVFRVRYDEWGNQFYEPIEYFEGSGNGTYDFYHPSEDHGSYIYAIELYDWADNWAYMNVTVVVGDGGPIGTVPEITGDSGSYNIKLGDPLTLVWHLKDDNPAIYDILVNDVIQIADQSWEDGDTVEFNASEWITTTDTYTFEIKAKDMDNNEASMKVSVTVASNTSYEDITPPDITGWKEKITIVEGENTSLTITIEDENPGSYELKRNDTLIESDTWVELPKTIIIDLSILTEGTYDYELTATDDYNNSITLYMSVYVKSDANDTKSETYNINAPGVLIVIVPLFILATMPVLRRKKNY